MNADERKGTIVYILLNDHYYDYEKVDFDFYTDEDLFLICQRLKQQRGADEAVLES